MKSNVELYVAVRNCITLICFTLLAIHFEKWWIVFCSALFWCYVTTKRV